MYCTNQLKSMVLYIVTGHLKQICRYSKLFPASASMRLQLATSQVKVGPSQTSIYVSQW
jgi:hypothetical protein